VNKEAIDDVLGTPDEYTSSNLTAIKNSNLSLLANSDAETNSKFMNSILIDNALLGNNFTETQLADLRILAAKCPYNDGVAVYQARAVLSHYEEVEYVNECEVIPFENNRAMSTEGIQEQEAAVTEFKLYPNPNDGSMNFVYSLNVSSKGQFVLYDITGKIINTYTLQQGINNQLFINETLLDNGMYFYKVIIDNELKMNDKIIISK